MTTYDFGVEGFAGYLKRVDDRLQKLAPESIGGLQRLLTASGKKLRPGLVIAVAYHSGKEIDGRVIAAATAVELVHIASLIHDDIMDGGEVRWGVPTISAREGQDQAILAGDYLLAKGCALAATVSAEAATVIAETIAALCIGQAYEQKDSFNVERTTESLLHAIRGKTSALFRASCELGGLVAGLPRMQLKILAEFAEDLGVAYQYLDDISDFTVSAEQAGKSVGNDIREGNYTLPVLFSLQGQHSSSLRALLKQNAPASQVLDILQRDDSIHRTIDEAESYKQKALQKLQEFDNTKLIGALEAFSSRLLQLQ